MIKSFHLFKSGPREHVEHFPQTAYWQANLKQHTDYVTQACFLQSYWVRICTITRRTMKISAHFTQCCISAFTQRVEMILQLNLNHRFTVAAVWRILHSQINEVLRAGKSPVKALPRIRGVLFMLGSKGFVRRGEFRGRVLARHRTKFLTNFRTPWKKKQRSDFPSCFFVLPENCSVNTCLQGNATCF